MISKRAVLIVSAALWAGAAGGGCEPTAAAARQADPSASYEMLRRTAVVEVYQACKDSVVNIGCSRQDPDDPDTKHTEYASGLVLHPAGYILTNAHLLRKGGNLAVGFEGGREFPARVVAVDEQHDLAILKIDADRRLKPLRFGRSKGLLVGERVVTMGNPFGMGLTVAEGIVSAIGRSTKSDYTFFPDMIQTDATTNPGSSGGPLLNVSGEMVGLNTTKKTGADNIAFAIPVDRIRDALPEVLDAEARNGFVVGVEVAADGPAQVKAVRDGSPAAEAGVRPGDVVVRIGEEDVQKGIDYHLALVGVAGSKPFDLQVLRDGQFRTMTVTPAVTPLRPPDDAANAKPGLSRAYYEGKWKRLPAFDLATAVETGRADTFDLGPYAGRNGFGLVFRGYVEAPNDGVYAFYTESDDGSRLRIGDQVVVENDGVREPVRRRGFIPLAKGRHAITVEFFDSAGDEHLEVSWQGPGFARVPIPAAVLFSDAP